MLLSLVIVALSSCDSAPTTSEIKPTPTSTTPLVATRRDINVNTSFVHHGYIKEDASTIVKQYIQDKDWYLYTPYSGTHIMRLQELLNRTRMARITNPAIGFQMLVPEGYRYSALSTEDRNDILLTFNPPVKQLDPPQHPALLSIWILKRNTSTAHSSMSFRDLADTILGRFASEHLNIQLMQTSHNGPVPSIESAESFVAQRLDVRENPPWLLSIYSTTNTNRRHRFRVGIGKSVFVVVHFEFSIDDALNFNNYASSTEPNESDFWLSSSSASMDIITREPNN